MPSGFRPDLLPEAMAEAEPHLSVSSLLACPTQGPHSTLPAAAPPPYFVGGDVSLPRDRGPGSRGLRPRPAG